MNWGGKYSSISLNNYEFGYFYVQKLKTPQRGNQIGGSTVFCSNCGNKLADGAKFCSECGARVATADEQSFRTIADIDFEEPKISPEVEEPREEPKREHISFD